MADEKSNLRLTVAVRGGGNVLLPEQSAFFDFAVENSGTEPALVAALSGNSDTPSYRVADAAGTLIVNVSPTDLYRRFGADMGEPEPEPLETTTIPPGESDSNWVDLWGLTDPLPDGTYTLSIIHLIDESGAHLESEPLAFQVVDARVTNVAMSYEDEKRRSSVLAWLAAPQSGGSPQILVRLSTSGNHGAAQRSGWPCGETSPDTRLALSAKPPEGTPTFQGWMAAVSAHESGVDRATLFSLNRASPIWRSEPIPLPVSDALPVPRFPDRDHAVFLAVGRLAGAGMALVGAVVQPYSDDPPTVWSVPLKGEPTHVVCGFTAEGPIALLMASETAGRTVLSRIDVTAEGTVAGAERVVRESPHRLYAIARNPGGFVVLEGDREHAGTITVVRIAIEDGEPSVQELGPLPAWPVIDDKPLAPVDCFLEAPPNGPVLFAFLDEAGNYYGAVADGSPVHLLAAATPERVMTLPHIAALLGQTLFSGFTSRGYLAYLGGF